MLVITVWGFVLGKCDTTVGCSWCKVNFETCLFKFDSRLLVDVACPQLGPAVCV